jgi:N-methylhydantoinase B/oxoprolinase/acetone carboxylase alpha subunit
MTRARFSKFPDRDCERTSIALIPDNWVERADGRREEFGATHTVAVEPGDVFVLETPGGGGYGKAAN